MHRLSVTSGPARGQSTAVDREIVIGREAADFVLLDPQVSRRHAVVRPAGAGVEIEDLGSANGTFVDGQRIDRPVTIPGSASLRVGNSELEVGPAQPAEPAPAAPAARPGRRRRTLVVLVVLAAAAAGIAVALVAILGSGEPPSRVFAARITTLPLGDPTSVVVSGVLEGKPVGRVTVIIQRTFARDPKPGGAAVPMTAQVLVIGPKGAMGFDLKGTLRLTSGGGEIVRGKAVSSRGGGEFKDLEGSFTLTGGHPQAHARMSRYSLDGTLRY